ncbi:MAG: site-2 protease family protein [Candidatus Nanopelagicales bacterium]
MAGSEADKPQLRIGGIPVSVPPSGILGIALLAYFWAPAFDVASVSPWLLAVCFAILLTLATLLHELAHAFAARRLGYPVRGVVLQTLGGVTHFERRRESALSEAAIAAAGPLATFAVAGASLLVDRALAPGTIGSALASAMLWANVVIGVYNSLPGLPLDGGVVLRCLVWAATGSERTGTTVAGWTGRALAVLTLVSPMLIAGYTGEPPDLLLYVVAGLLGAMLWSGATAQMRAVDLRDRSAGLTAAGLARRAIPVDRDLPLAEALRRAGAAGAGALVIVDHSGAPTGIGHHDAIEAVPPQRRPWITVGSVARPVDEGSVLSSDLAGPQLIAEVAKRGRDELLVIDPGGLVYGVLLVADIEAALRG